MNIALIVFAGKGERINSSIPKQFIKINGKDIVCYTIETFNNHPLIDEIVLVTSSDFLNYTKSLVINNRYSKVSFVVEGGKTRQESISNGLNSINYGEKDNILIHDGDRPLVSFEIITSCIKTMDFADCAMVALRSEEALSKVSNLGRKYNIDNVSYDIQTPQCFKFKLIKDVHNKLKDQSFNDDASMVSELGYNVTIIKGSPKNFKVTTDRDLEYLKSIISEE